MSLSDEGSPFILGIGGTLRTFSATERALRTALQAAERFGARTMLIGGDYLEFPIYSPDRRDRDEMVDLYLDAIGKCDGLVIASPAYHGGVSGLMKNALDYLEELADHERPYLSGRAVACLTTAAGWQGGCAALVSLRQTVHALRGTPTPLGVVINTLQPEDRAKGDTQIGELGREVVQLARALNPDGNLPGGGPSRSRLQLSGAPASP